jgi:branched-chain amino acid transport system permease protein
VLTGGLGTVLGPTVGALILTAMDYYFAEFGSWLLVIEGVFFIVFVMVFRRGVVGEILVLAHRWRHRDDGSPTVKAVIAGETTSGTPAQ